ncbi:MAG: gliding motility protein GldM [Bacteroidales bacterium]|jgi:gliding motility-associated protein GldM|nr:gliding motility protein GldM [Bacteroidales bacterium]
MGATNCPETPRQRMIGMMYLVLTAMLALNVSKDILNAFVVVDETLVNSNKNIDATITSDYSFIERQQLLFGEAKVGDAFKKAQQLKNESEAMISFIETMKSELLKEADKTDLNKEGQLKSAKEIESKDDWSASSRYFINEKNAEKLKTKLITYKSSILALLPDKVSSQIGNYLGLDVDGKYYNSDGEVESWETHNFDHSILIACVTLMNKIEGEVKNAESMVLKQIIAGISGDDFKFDVVKGKTIPETRMVFRGETYEADIIVAAYDSKSTPEVYYKMGVDTLREADLGSATRLDGIDGVVKLRLPAGSEGDQRYAGLIKVKRPDGTYEPYGFKDKYTVLAPSATVAADKMNVFYSGIENPVSISAAVDPSKLSLSIPGCTATKIGNGKYMVTVPSSQVGKPVTCTVTGEIGGKTQTLGTTEFRVKQVPSPQVSIGGNITGGKRNKAELVATPQLIATMGQDFVYDLKWTVISFRVIFQVRGMEEPAMAISGGRFSDELVRKINSAAPGTTIWFEDIKVSSSAGSRNIPNITVRIK